MSTMDQESQQVFDNADILYDPNAVSAAYDQMAAQITQRVGHNNPVFLPIMLGGLFVASELMKRLKFPLQIDYLHATRYRGELHGGDLIWKVMPGIDLAGRVVVVIDDILDEGHTLAAVQRALHAQEPAELITTVLVEKQHDRRAPNVEVDVVGLKAEDRYLFGCGMDYKGYLRQHPAIYAVKGS